MNRPSRPTVIAGTVGALALVAAVAAAATSSGTPETTQLSTLTQASTPRDATPTGKGDSADDTARSEPSGSENTITPDQAVAIAEQELMGVGSAPPPLDEVEKEMEHGRTVWKVEFGDDLEVYVDAITGEVIRLDQDEDDRGDDDRGNDDRGDADDDRGNDDRGDDDHDDDRDDDRGDDD